MANHPGLVRYNSDDCSPKQIKSPQDRGFPALLGGDAEHDPVIWLLDGLLAVVGRSSTWPIIKKKLLAGSSDNDLPWSSTRARKGKRGILC